MPKTKSLTLKKSDIVGNYWFEARIEPSSEQQEMLRMQMAQAFRAPGPDGRPLMSDRDIRRFVQRDPHPEETGERAALQWLESNDQQVQEMVTAALRRKWRAANARTVAEAEKELNPAAQEEIKMPRAKFEQLVQAAAQAEHAKMLGQDPGQLVAAAEGAQAQMAQRSLAPPTALPYQEAGPSPEVMPTQLGMTGAPQPMTATPEVLAMQMRRGRPQP